jgi:hypothetical protein
MTSGESSIEAIRFNRSLHIVFVRRMFRALFLPVIIVSVVMAAQPAPLTPDEAKALREPIDLGHRLLAALSRYPQPSASSKASAGIDLITSVPTVELLHSAGYVTDSDLELAHGYRATLQAVPAGSGASQPLLSMHTDRGELTFARDGTLALQHHE